ncbi:MAG: SPOR domain-containing protein [Candidatus Omnitrophica bacterium]|jgi:tetratricopeptide (TPR) repeat protein|nr:SPOR domain-containing protein [Candidatus Omnitrophota bacterium]
MKRQREKAVKFLILSFGFTFFALSFSFVSRVYALDLEKIKVDILRHDYKAAIIEGEILLGDTKHDEKGMDELYYLLGISYLKDANYLRASDIFEIVINEFQDSKFKTKAKIGLGDTFFLREDYTKAQGIYEGTITDSEFSVVLDQIYYRLSQCALKKGDTVKSQNYLAKLKDPSFSCFQLKPEEVCPKEFYCVQVGAFSEKNNALELKDRLYNQGFDSYLVQSENSGKPVYKVRVGKLNSLQEAQVVEKKLSGQGLPTKIFP